MQVVVSLEPKTIVFASIEVIAALAVIVHELVQGEVAAPVIAGWEVALEI